MRCSVVRELATELLPIVVEFAADLTYPTGADAVLFGQIQGSLAGHHVLDEAAVALGTSAEPGREVEAKHYLLRHRRAGVVDQGLLQRVGVQGREVRQFAHAEPAALLGQLVQDVFRL